MEKNSKIKPMILELSDKQIILTKLNNTLYKDI